LWISLSWLNSRSLDVSDNVFLFVSNRKYPRDMCIRLEIRQKRQNPLLNNLRFSLKMFSLSMSKLSILTNNTLSKKPSRTSLKIIIFECQKKKRIQLLSNFDRHFIQASERYFEEWRYLHTWDIIIIIDSLPLPHTVVDSLNYPLPSHSIRSLFLSSINIFLAAKSTIQHRMHRLWRDFCVIHAHINSHWI